MEFWPSVPDDYGSVFRHYFKEPRRLHAAFDDSDSAIELVTALFPDLIPERIHDIAAEMVLWAEDSAVGFKRRRKMFMKIQFANFLHWLLQVFLTHLVQSLA